MKTISFSKHFSKFDTVYQTCPDDIFLPKNIFHLIFIVQPYFKY